MVLRKATSVDKSCRCPSPWLSNWECCKEGLHELWDLEALRSLHFLQALQGVVLGLLDVRLLLATGLLLLSDARLRLVVVRYCRGVLGRGVFGRVVAVEALGPFTGPAPGSLKINHVSAYA